MAQGHDRNWSPNRKVTNKDLSIKGRTNSTSTRWFLASAHVSAFLLAPALRLDKGGVKPQLGHVQ